MKSPVINVQIAMAAPQPDTLHRPGSPHCGGSRGAVVSGYFPTSNLNVSSPQDFDTGFIPTHSMWGASSGNGLSHAESNCSLAPCDIGAVTRRRKSHTHRLK